MKFDLHCHTKEGSLDSKVSVKEFVHKFMALGFNGFMISDHNSYKGCRAWDKIKNDPRYKDFCVIRGVEYDTKDAGHILVIMPDDLYLPIMKILSLIHIYRLSLTAGLSEGLPDIPAQVLLQLYHKLLLPHHLWCLLIYGIRYNLSLLLYWYVPQISPAL